MVHLNASNGLTVDINILQRNLKNRRHQDPAGWIYVMPEISKDNIKYKHVCQTMEFPAYG